MNRHDRRKARKVKAKTDDMPSGPLTLSVTFREYEHDENYWFAKPDSVIPDGCHIGFAEIALCSLITDTAHRFGCPPEELMASLASKFAMFRRDAIESHGRSRSEQH
jgi:hypothetical protein